MHLSSALLYLAAGASILLAILNRYIMGMRDGWYKPPLIAAAVVTLLAVPAAFGLLHGHSTWSWAPAFILGGVGLGEAHRVSLRRRYRGHTAAIEHHRAASIARPLTTLDLAVARFDVTLPSWSGDGLRIAHASDFHVNDSMPVRYFEEMWQRIADADPDILLLTGDFVSKARHVPLLREVLATKPEGLRIFSVLGNHDYWCGPDSVAEALMEAGVELIGNRHIRLGPGVIVSGCEDPWSNTEWTAPARQEKDALIVLSHTADNIYRLNRAGADMVFSGHYHAGQFRVPRLGSIVVPSAYGRRFDHGHFIVNGTHLFVTAGIGSGFPALRIYCPPDLFLVNIKSDRQLLA